MWRLGLLESLVKLRDDKIVSLKIHPSKAKVKEVKDVKTNEV